MNLQIMTRMNQLKQYISNIDQNVNNKHFKNAMNLINKAKEVINGSTANENPSIFVYQSLKTKNQKLKRQVKTLLEQKGWLETKIQQNKQISRQMIIRSYLFTSRFALTLNDSQKIYYEEVLTHWDHNQIVVKQEDGGRYNQLSIRMSEITNIEQKGIYLYLFVQPSSKQPFHCLFKYNDQRDAKRCASNIHFTQMIWKCKQKKKLFLKQQPKIQKPFIFEEEIPTLTFSTVINQNDKSSDRKQANSNDKLERNSENSYKNIIGIINSKQMTELSLSKKNEVSRYDPNRLRGKSEYTSQPLQISKIYRAGARKDSEDIFKSHVNQSYHQKMLGRYRFQRQSEQSESELNFTKKRKKNQQITKSLVSPRLQSLEDRKTQLLKNTKLKTDKSKLSFDNKVTWIGIEERVDQNKSRSSNPHSQKSRNNSDIPSDNEQKNKQKINEQNSFSKNRISEKSEQQSPMLPKKISYDFPHKMEYPNGIKFILHPVERSESPQKNQLNNNDRSSIQSALSDSDDNHIEISSHQNHTQSEDNTIRIEELKKGIILTKCAQGGFWTRQKILYLSENETQVCSRDVKDKKVKKIKINDIQSVEYKKFYKGILKHISKVEDQKCMVIKAVAEDKKIKNYEYVGNLAEPLEHFAENLKQFIDMIKKK